MAENVNIQSVPNPFALDPDRCFAQCNARHVSLGNLISHARQVSEKLPDQSYAINQCKDRYLFTVTYLAVVLRGQINLLPQNHTTGCVEKLLRDYPECYCIDDQPGASKGSFVVSAEQLQDTVDPNVPRWPHDQVTSISFTSGSTGKPKSIAKTFGEFCISAQLATKRLGLTGKDLVLVSTVPAQHMYGLETSIFWPLLSGAAIHSQRPFFPEDIRRVIAETEKACVLISTPTHLKACVESSLQWANLDLVISSTAPLSAQLASTVENKFGAPVMEIFGSTETMSFASRSLRKSRKWQPYSGIRVSRENDQFQVEGGHIVTPIPIDDRVELDQSGHFRLLGRSSDLVKIGGKRASLAELNQLINQMEGISDGLFYVTESGRLGALVVSQRSKRSILQELRHSVDEVFLPRPFHRIEKIPRNEVGKVVKLKLDRLIKKLEIA